MLINGFTHTPHTNGFFLIQGEHLLSGFGVQKSVELLGKPIHIGMTVMLNCMLRLGKRH